MTLSPAAQAASQTAPASVWTHLEQDLGDSARAGSFTLTDPRIKATSLVVIQPASQGGDRGDEPIMDPLFCVAVAGSGQATVYWTAFGEGPVAGVVAFNYTVG